MFFSVPDDLAYCVAGKSVIFLDLRTNRYVGLPATTAAAFGRLIDSQGHAEVGDRHQLEQLAAKGFLTVMSEPTILRRHPPVVPPSEDMSRDGVSQPSLFYYLIAAYAQIKMMLNLRSSSVTDLLSRISAKSTGAAPEASAQEAIRRKIFSAFARVDYILGSAERCLVRSLAMYWVCRKLGITAQLVIAVRSEPFTAHCWVQQGEIVLNDRMETVADFTPILVVK